MIDTRIQPGRDPDTAENAGESLTGLFGGIVGDFQELVKQQFALFKREIHEDVRKTKEGVSSLAVGGVLVALAAVLLCFTAVHALHWAYPNLPLWSCFGIVAAGLGIVGGVILYLGLRRLKSFSPLPDESLATLKENVQWIANPK